MTAPEPPPPRVSPEVLAAAEQNWAALNGYVDRLVAVARGRLAHNDEMATAGSLIFLLISIPSAELAQVLATALVRLAQAPVPPAQPAGRGPRYDRVVVDEASRFGSAEQSGGGGEPG